MIKYLLTLFAIFLSVSAQTADIDDALEFVEKTGSGKNFTAMTFRAAKNNKTYQIVSADLGESKAQHLLIQELKATIPLYQDQWNKNLAFSYLEYLSAEKLKSILSDQDASPHLKELLSSEKNIGKSMQSKSTKLLSEAVSEVMLNVFNASTSNKQLQPTANASAE